MSVKRLSYLCSITSIVLAVALAGCGGGGEESTNEAPASGEPAATSTPAPEAAAPSAAPAAGSGSIAGKVSFEGTPPARSTLETAGDAKCAEMHADAPLLSDREVVSADGGVHWAFIYVKNPPAGDHPVPTEQAKLDQVGCQYTPHVLGVRVGQTLEFHNSDPLLHNVRAITRNRSNKPINYSQPPTLPPRTKVFDAAEMEIRVKCDIHPWMTAYVFAMDHPFFAVSDEQGNFKIDGLPAGDHTVVMWHEAYGEQEATVTVTAGGTAEANFTTKAAE